MASIKRYIVSFEGDVSKLVSSIETAKKSIDGLIAGFEIDDVFNKLILDVDVSKSSEKIKAAFAEIGKHIPLFDQKLRYDQAVEQIDYIEYNKKKYSGFRDIISRLFSVDTGDTAAVDSAKENVKQHITSFINEINEAISSGDAEKVREKVEDFFIFSNELYSKKKTRDFLPDELKNASNIDDALRKFLIDANKLQELGKGEKFDISKVFLGRLSEDTSVADAMLAKWKSIRDTLRKELVLSGVEDPDAEFDFSYIAKAANESAKEQEKAAARAAGAQRKSADSAKEAAQETVDAQSKVGEAAREAAEETSKAAEAADENINKVSNSIKGFNVSEIVEQIKTLTRILLEMTSIQFTGGYEKLEEGLRSAFSQKSAKDKKDYLNTFLFNGSGDKTALLDIYNKGNSLQRQLGDSEDFYRQYAEYVARYMTQAGMSVEKFLNVQRVINTDDLTREVNSSLDPVQIQTITTSISNLEVAINSLRGKGTDLSQLSEALTKAMDGFKPQLSDDAINKLSDFLSVLKEVIYELQRLNGITSNTRLSEEFDRLVADTASLGNGSLSVLSGGRQQLKNIVERFNQYKAAGGNKSLESLTDNKTLLAKLKEVRQEMKSSENADAEAKSLEGVATAAEKAAASKEAFNAANTKLGEGAEASQKQLDAEHEGLKQLDGSELGADKAKELSEHLQSAYDSLSRLIGLLSGGGVSEKLKDMLEGWVEGEQDIIDTYGHGARRERKAIIDKSGKIWFNYSTGDRGSVSNVESFDTLKSSGAKPYVNFHSHPANFASMSLIDKDLKGGDLFAFIQQYKKGVEKQVVTALREIEVFDTKGFMEAYGDKFDFDSDDVKKRVRNARDDLEGEMSPKRHTWLPEMLGANWRPMMEKVALNASQYTGAEIDVDKLIADVTEKLQSVSRIQRALNRALKAQGIESDYALNEFDLYKFLGNYLGHNSGNKERDEKEIDDEIFQFNLGKVTPEIMERALGISDFSSFIKKYSSVEEFIADNPLNLDNGSLNELFKSGSFDTTGLTDAINTIKNLVKSLGSEDGIAKLGALKEGIGGLIEVLNTPVTADSFIKELSGLAATGGSLKDLATVLKSSKKEMAEAKKNLDGAESKQKKTDTEDPYLKERQRRAAEAEENSSRTIAAERKAAEQRRKEREREAAQEAKQAERERKAEEAAQKKAEAKTLSDEFQRLGKSTRDIRKLLGVDKGTNEERNQAGRIWDNYFKQYEEAMSKISVDDLGGLPTSFNSSMQYISQILFDADELKTTLDSMSLPKELKTEAGELGEKLQEIVKYFDGDFSFEKIVALGPKLKEFFGYIDEAQSFKNKAPSAVSDVQSVLNRALSIKGKTTDANINIELNGVIADLQQAISEADKLGVEFTTMDPARLAEIREYIEKIGADSNVAADAFGKFSESLSNQIRNGLTQFVMRFMSIMDLIRYAKQAAQVVVQVDSAITELRKVSGESNTRLQESFKTSAATAQELGATISEVINSTADWARLGYDIDQAEELARVTQMLQTVGDNMTQESASSSLISILQGYHIDPSQAERTIDSINEVANNFAIDTAGIGDALQRSAASFNAAGTDLNKSIALVTTANAVVQNPESVGNMFKTMSARIRGAKTELAELEEEEDEYTQTTSKMRDLVRQLTGFDIMKDENTFKDIYEIMVGIGDKWDELTDIQQASLGEALAGKRGANTLYAVLNNIDTLKDAYGTALGAEGSAAKEQEAYAQSVQYSIDRFKASTEELAVSFMSSDFLKGLIERGNSAIQIIASITDKLGSLGSVLATLGTISIVKTLLTRGQSGIFGNILTALAQSFNGGKEITGGLKEIFSIIGSGLKTEVAAAAKDAGKEGGGILAKHLGAAFAAHPIGFGAGITAAVVAAFAIGASIIRERQKKLIEDAKSSVEKWTKDQQSLEENYKTVYDLRDKLDHDETLSDNERLEIKKQIYEIQKQITEQYGIAASGIDLINGKLETQKDLLISISQEEARKNIAENSAEYRAAESMATSKISVGGFEVEGGSAGKVGQDISKAINDLSLDASGFGFNDAGNFFLDFWGGRRDITSDVYKIREALQTLRDEYEQTRNAATVSSKGGEKEYQAFIKQQDNYIKQVDRAIDELNANTKKATNEYNNVKDQYEAYLQEQFFSADGGKLATETAEAVKNTTEAMLSGDDKAFKSGLQSIENYKKEITGLAESIGWDETTTANYISSLTSGLDESAIKAYQLKEVLGMISSDSYKNMKESAERYNSEVEEARKYNVDFNKTQYGNIDLANRKRIDWTAEEIKNQRAALESWGRTDGEYQEIFEKQGESAAEAWLVGYVNSLEGSFSTVFSGSGAFNINGEEVEIAYSPILQSRKPKMLDVETVNQYISDLIDLAMKDGQWSVDELLQLDKAGIAYGDKYVRGLIAGIGEGAEDLWPALHFAGIDGAVDDAEKQMTEAADTFSKDVSESVGEDNPFKDQAEELIEYSDTVKQAGLDSVDVAKMLSDLAITGDRKVEPALQRLASAYGVMFDGTEADQARIESFIKTMAESGIIFDGTVSTIKNASDSFKTFRTEFAQTYANIDAVNASLANAMSGKGMTIEYDDLGNLAGDIGNIMNAYKDLDSFHAGDIFRTTANGVKINEKELRRLQKEQEKITRKKFLDQQKKQTLALMVAERARNQAMAQGKDLSSYDSEISKIKDQLSQLDYLQTAYDGATSAYQKWIAAQSAGEAGDIYDNMRENLVTRADELWKQGLTGTEEFRAAAQLISGQDLSTAGIEEVETAYKQLDATIEGSSVKVRDFFAEEGKGVNNFLQAMIDLGYATEDSAGNVTARFYDTEEMAKSFGTSVDIVEASLQKLKDYGFEIEWFTPEQGKQLEELEKKYDKVQKHIEKSGLSDILDIDYDSLNTVNDIDDAIQRITRMIDEPGQFNINSQQAVALNELLGILIEKKKILSEPTNLDVPTVEGYKEAQANLDELISRIEEFNELSEEHPELGLDIENEEEIQQLAEWLSKLPEGIRTSLSIEIPPDAQQIINQLSNGYSTTTTTNNEQNNITNDITNDVENHYVSYEVDSTQLEIAQQWINELTFSTPEEIATQIVCETYGIDDINELSDAEKEVVDRKITVLAKAIGEKDVNYLAHAINNINDKTVNITANTSNAINQVNSFKEFWKGWQPSTKFANVQYRELKINGTAHSGGTVSGAAYAGGSWGLKSNQKSLINEVGPEIVIRGSNWFIPNNGRPTMGYPLKKGDIVFNAKQTEQLLKNGYVTSGYAKASGTALAGGNLSGNRKRLDGNTPTPTTPSNNNSNKTKSSNNNSDKSSTKAAEEAAENIKDWIEVLLDRISRALENFKSMAEYWTSYVDQNRELNNAIAQARSNIVDNQRAYARYIQQANSVGLPESYAKKVRNGEINIEEIKDEKLQEKIEKYTEWYLQMPTRSVMAA